MTFTFSVDASSLESAVERAAKALSDFTPEMREVRQVMAQETDARIRSGNFAPLAPATIQRRRERAKRTGRNPVAGFETPLRDTDTLRRSLVEGGAEKNIGYSDKDEAVLGTSLPQARRLQEGGDDLPARAFLVIGETMQERSVEIVRRGIERRIGRL